MLLCSRVVIAANIIIDSNLIVIIFLDGGISVPESFNQVAVDDVLLLVSFIQVDFVVINPRSIVFGFRIGPSVDFQPSDLPYLDALETLPGREVEQSP